MAMQVIEFEYDCESDDANFGLHILMLAGRCHDTCAPGGGCESMAGPPCCCRNLRARLRAQRFLRLHTSLGSDALVVETLDGIKQIKPIVLTATNEHIRQYMEEGGPPLQSKDQLRKTDLSRVPTFPAEILAEVGGAPLDAAGIQAQINGGTPGRRRDAAPQFHEAIRAGCLLFLGEAEVVHPRESSRTLRPPSP